MKLHVIFMRHGQTNGTLLRRYMGRTDEPLCKIGTLTSTFAGVRPSVEHVFVSPLKRARETASLCFPNARQHVFDDLQEMDFGLFENRSADEMADDPAYRNWVENNCTPPCPDGESREAFSDRVCRAFTDILKEAEDLQLKKVIIVAHGGTIMSALSRFVPDLDYYYEWAVPPCQGWAAETETSDDPPVLSELCRFSRLVEVI